MRYTDIKHTSHIVLCVLVHQDFLKVPFPTRNELTAVLIEDNQTFLAGALMVATVPELTGPEQTGLLLHIIRELSLAENLDALLRAFIKPLVGDAAASALLVYVEPPTSNSEAETIIEILASCAHGEFPNLVSSVGTRLRQSEVPFIQAFLADPVPVQGYDLRSPDSDLARLLAERWREYAISGVSAITLIKEGRVVGIVVVRWAEARSLTPEETALYTEVAPVMAALVESQHQLLEQHRAIQLTDALYQAYHHLIQAEDYDQILNVVFSFASQTGAQTASLVDIELDSNGQFEWGTVIARAGTPEGPGSPLGSQFYLPDLPFTRHWQRATDDLLLIENGERDSRVDAVTLAVWQRTGIRAAVLMPLHVKGNWIGLLSVSWTEPHLFTPFERQFYKALSTQVATALENQRLHMRERLALEQLAEQEAHYRLLAENATDMILRVGTDGLVIYVSPSVYSLLGYRPEELAGRMAGDFLHPDDRHALGPSMAAQISVEDIFENQFRMRCSDQSYVWVEVLGRVLRDSTGQLREYISVIRNISKRKAAEDHVIALNAELREQAQKLEYANRELEAFTYSVSHDLRAPLRAMDGFSKILIEKYSEELPEEARRYLERVRVNALQMGNLIDDLLSLSRVTKRALERNPVNMRRIAEDAMQEVLGTDPPRVNFILHDLPESKGDSSLLKQVYVNLLANAVKFSRQSPDPTIVVSSTQEAPNQTVYTVSDNGVGFDMQYADKVFGVFQRLHNPREYEGTGVGLAIVSRIIARHGGHIWVDSRIGEGTTFFFTVGGQGAGADH